MKQSGIIMSTVAMMAVLLTVLSSRATANDGFTAGAAQISAPCHIEFDARATGGHVNEQCAFATGREHFAGPVLCFAASENLATFVWQLQMAPQEKQGLYQQVFILDNGAPGQGVPDEFFNYPESGYNPCPNISAFDPPETSPVLKGNFVVSPDE